MNPRYYVHMRLPQRLQKIVLQYEKEFQEHSRSDPHVTLLMPFLLLPKYREKDLVRGLHEAVRDVAPFSLSTTRVGFFADKENVHFCVGCTPSLRLLRRRLNGVVRNMGSPKSGFVGKRFHPHITLAQHLSGACGKILYKQARAVYQRYEFACTEIFLMRIKDSEKRWQKVASIQL